MRLNYTLVFKRGMLLLLVSVLFYGCAQQFMPTGGPIDRDPPLFMSSTPADQEVNVKTKRIQLRFNEFIKEEKLKEQLIISPSIENPYTSSIRRNELILEFENELDTGITYTMDFRAGIVDITEGNVAENVRITFSTGRYIDSLEIRGNTVDLMRGMVIPNLTVGLYLDSDTLNPYRMKPRYFTKTDSAGNFRLRSLTPSTYQLYVWQDKNDNLIINSKDEKHGYYPDKIELKENTNVVKVPIVMQHTDTLVLNSARQSGRDFVLRFNKKLANFQLQAEDTTKTIYYLYNNTDQAFRIYNTFPEMGKDSIQVRYQVSDSVGFSLDSTIYVSFNQDSRAEKDALEWRSIPTGPAKIRRNEPVVLKFTKPILKTRVDSIYSEIDSVFTYYDLNETLVFDKTRTEAQVNFNRDSLTLGKTLTYVIPDKGIISVEGDTLERILITFDLRDPKDYGTIKGTVRNMGEEDQFWVQLLTDRGELRRELKNQIDYSFELVEPGSYMIRILHDVNKDGKWNPGNGWKREAPEPIYFYKKPNAEPKEDARLLVLRANWELTDININTGN